MTLMEHTGHRKRIPTVRRHGYCEPARNDDPYHREDKLINYCFCNDWNGCNSADGMHGKSLIGVLTGLLAMCLSHWMLH